MRKLNAFILAFLINALIFAPVAFPATLGYQIDMLLSQVRTAAGGAITNGHVHFYAAGGTTDKTIWTTVNKTTPAANPYNLDSNGTAYVFGDGLYRIVIHTAPDVTSPLMVVTHGPTAYDRDNIRYEDFGTTMTRLTVITGDNTGTLSGFKTISGPGTGNISGFDNGTFTGRMTSATATITTDNITTANITTLNVTGTPTFVDNTINGADVIDNTLLVGKIAASGTKDNTTFLRGDGAWTAITDNGTFTATLTGCTTSPTGTVYWTKAGKIVTLNVPQIAGTSNTTAATLTGLPAALIPVTSNWALMPTLDNSVTAISTMRVQTSGVILLYKDLTTTTFTAAGTKGVNENTVTYSLD